MSVEAKDTQEVTMHPLVYYSILELERDERVRVFEQERSARERLHDERAQRSAVRVGHARVAAARPSLRARLRAALRGRAATPGRIAGTGPQAGAGAMIGCRA